MEPAADGDVIDAELLGGGGQRAAAREGREVAEIDVEDIGPRRSLMLARPSVMRFMADRDAYRSAAHAVIAEGLVPDPGASYRLADAAQAHRDLEAGTTTGAAVLLP